MNRSLFAAAALSLLASACTHPADPLDEYRATCRALQSSGQLKAGLAIDECAKQLKTASDETDPVKRAQVLVEKIQSQVTANKGKPANDELKLALAEVQGIGKPAVPALQSHFEGSKDPEVRIALAKALVAICYSDCASQKFDCVVPALLEGVGADKPAEVRQASVAALQSCTGKEYGDDASAWSNWWASARPHAP